MLGRENNKKRTRSESNSFITITNNIKDDEIYIKQQISNFPIINQKLINERNKQINEAEKIKNLQIKNIHDLFDFTVKEINDKYLRDVEKLKNDYNACLELEKQLNTKLETQNGLELVHSTILSNCKGNDVHSRESIQKRSNSKGSISLIDKTISEESVREDLVSIVRDLEDRAYYFINQQRENHLLLPQVEYNDGCVYIRSNQKSSHHQIQQQIQQLQQRHYSSTSTTESIDSTSSSSVDEMILSKGSLVTIIGSGIGPEGLSGVIVVTSEDDLIVRLHTGPRIRIPFYQIRQQRVSLILSK